MKPQVIDQLVQLNRSFYEDFGDAFSDSRGHLNDGIRRALKDVPPGASVLDVGCGDGRVAGALIEDNTNWLDYLGVDSSQALLARARSTFADDPRVRFEQIDVAQLGWNVALMQAGNFGALLSFSVLHHIPTTLRREALLRQLHQLAGPGAALALSVWQLLHVPSLAQKVVNWSELGLVESDVETGDLLIDWRGGGRGLRYVHHFHPDELSSLCQATGWDVRESYRSDGRTKDLGLYVLASARS